MEDLFIELSHLVQVYGDRNGRGQKDNDCVVDVFFIPPQHNAEHDEQVKRSKDFPAEEHQQIRLFDDHCSRAVGRS